MVSAYAESEREREALQLLSRMRADGVEPNNYTYVGLLKACASFSDLETGRALHVEVCRNGYSSDIFVANTLLRMYTRCGAVLEAENVFESLVQRDVVSWNVMLTAYVEHEEEKKALRLYRQMQNDSIDPDQLTFALILQVCTTLAENSHSMEDNGLKITCLKVGQTLHAIMRRKNILFLDIVVGNTLITMYCKCGTLYQAESMFKEMQRRDLVSWNAMLSAYIEHGQADHALRFYCVMQQEGQIPDQLTYVFALQACGILAQERIFNTKKERVNRDTALKIGQALHSDACRRGFLSDAIVSNAVVTMYGKCGTLAETEEAFRSLSQWDTASFNSLLSVYVEHGWGEIALFLYREMCRQQVILDELTFLCLLQGCSEAGSLALSLQLHFDVVAMGYDTSPLLVTTILHSHGNCASISDGKATFEFLQEPDGVTWNALADVYAGEGSWFPSICIHDEARLSGIEPTSAPFTSALTACCHNGLVHEGIQYFCSIETDYNLTVDEKHFGIIVDLLGRAGAFKHLEKFLLVWSIQADLTIWLSLLGACKTHANLALAKYAFSQAVSLHPKHPTAYVLMANIYDDVGMQYDSLETDELRCIECI
ncbi:hypothetical protein KP509_08G045700 [Ceratopteris richardii]|nr:hypothetical protein KP509_08G045700 [Ceratopteris richardii]